MSDLGSASSRKSFREFYLPRRHTALLVVIVVFLGVRPVIGEINAARYVFSLLQWSPC
jgi:hypothetical protein